MKLLEKIFSLKYEGNRKVICILGLKFKFRSSSKLCEHIIQRIDERIIQRIEYYRVPGFSRVSSVHEQIESVVHTAMLHQKSFSDLRYINLGKDVVVCGTGPTLDYYSPIKNAVHIGVKEAFKSTKIDFDYLFCHDVSRYKSKILPLEFVNYRGENCIKFIGNSVPFSMDTPPKKNEIRFFNSANALNYQIDYLPLPDYSSIIFAAFSFALWTRPKRIFIVGADCSNTGYAKNTKIEQFSNASFLVKHWKIMKNFVNEYYPDVELISINPVGLKGLFKDIYTKEYLDDNIEKRE